MKSASSKSQKLVVLLHGFAAHWILMTRLKAKFECKGFRALNWGYKSWFRSIDEHASRLHQTLTEIDADPTVSSIDFVTHSMGCIVTRGALAKAVPKKFGRWVMLAPPNQGSFVADKCPRVIKRLLKPVDELQTSDESYVKNLPIPPGIDIAIIQATADYIVSESLTRIPEEKDRIIVPGLHSQMLFREDVAEQSMHFLLHGAFEQTTVRES